MAARPGFRVRFAGGFRVWLVRVVWLTGLAVGNVVLSELERER